MRRRFTRAERGLLLEEFGGKCAYCGCGIGGKTMKIDFIVPLERNGSDDIANAFPVCAECHKYKGVQLFDDFRESVARIPLSLGRKTASFRMLQRMGFVPKGMWDVEFHFEKLAKEGRNIVQMPSVKMCDCRNCRYGETAVRGVMTVSRCVHPSDAVREKNVGDFLKHRCVDFVAKDCKTLNTDSETLFSEEIHVS